MDDFIDRFADIPPTLTIPIEPPIKEDGRDYSQIVLREPRAGEKRKAEEQLRNGVTPSNLRNHDHYLIHFASGLPLVVVEKLPISRTILAMEYLDRFLANGPRTGGN